MTDAFICDAVRTPIGRYGGALAAVRADDLAALPIAALLARNPALDGARSTRCCSAAPTRPARTTATWRAWRLLLAGLPVTVPGATVNRLCGSGLDAWRWPRARSVRARRARHRRRRRVHVPCAVRDAQGRERLRAQRGDLRHHHRLALRQSAHEDAIRRRLDARDRRERRRRIRHRRADQDASRCAARSAPRPPTRAASSPASSCRSRSRSARASR